MLLSLLNHPLSYRIILVDTFPSLAVSFDHFGVLVGLFSAEGLLHVFFCNPSRKKNRKILLNLFCVLDLSSIRNEMRVVVD